jgi:hypothetical protein
MGEAEGEVAITVAGNIGTSWQTFGKPQSLGSQVHGPSRERHLHYRNRLFGMTCSREKTWAMSVSLPRFSSRVDPDEVEVHLRGPVGLVGGFDMLGKRP